MWQLIQRDADWMIGGMIGAITGWINSHFGIESEVLTVVLANFTRSALVELIAMSLLGAFTGAVAKELVSRLFRFVFPKRTKKKSEE